MKPQTNLKKAPDESPELGQPKTLKHTISIIPKCCYKNPAWKGIAYTVRDASLYFAIAALLMLTDNILLLIPLWVLCSLSVSALFILGHDASHGALFRNKRIGDALGKLLMLPSLHAYSAWGLGHNRVHHSWTVKEEKDFVWHPLSYEEYKELSRFGKLMHRIYWSPVGAGIYYLIEIWWKKMITYAPPRKLAKEIQSDKRIVLYFSLFTIVLMACIANAFSWSMAYALWCWTKIIAVPWLMFNYIIGATVHIHHIQPDLAWHNDAVWDKFKGQVEGTTNFRIPAWLNVFFHNIFIHIPHHVDPRIPFYNLPKAAEAIRRHYPFSVRGSQV